MERLRVALEQRSYDIAVGRGLLAQSGTIIAPVVRQKRVVVVSDEHVASLHLERFRAGLAVAGLTAETILLPPGEETKDFAHFAQLCEDVLSLGVERATPIIALGGGVVGDLAGFAAATLLRGLDFVQVPTTLLAQVDSAVGGKTAIDTRHGKNLVGAFHQPVLVLADVDVLETLPRRELIAGYAEVVKYGLIGDRTFFGWLEVNAGALLAGDAALRQEAVLRSCAAKAAIVAVDEREAGKRALLNLGHTFGHALETLTGFGKSLLHGEAVALGMQLAFDLSARLGFCPPAAADRTRRHLSGIGLPTGLATIPSVTPDALIAAMQKDKKVSGGRLTLVLARDIGEAFLCQDVLPATLGAFLADAAASGKNSLEPARLSS
jgi:3-dehydroquinate synthase